MSHTVGHDTASLGGVKRVVGAAIIRDGRVLAARRAAPDHLAGRWEFPGGKVEQGESVEAALVREIAEELGVSIAVSGWLPGEAAIGSTHLLSVALATLESGTPRPTEHDRVRWLARGELAEVDWLEPDRPFLTGVAAALAAAEESDA